MDFVESLAIRLPDIEAQLRGADLRESAALVIEVAAIHEGVTQNFNRYPALELASSLPTWTSPYQKPVILHHDPYTDALGRVIGSRMDKEDDDGSSYIRLQVAVTDTEAVQKVKDKRYLTGSVGGRAGKATCTICKADWANASIFDLPCKHIRGREYDGKLAMIDMAEITWKEYSFVNMPADDRSGIRKLDAADGAGAGDKNQAKGRESVDFYSARFFCLDLKKEGISEFAESAVTHDVLNGLETNAASSLYHALKGAFLSAVATSKEDDVAVPITPTVTPTEGEGEDDVLAVSETLSDDLATTGEHDPDAVDEEPDPVEEPDEEPAADGEPAEPEPDAEEEAEEHLEEPAAAEEPDGEPDDADDVGEEPAAQDDEPEESEDEEPEADESENPLQARVTELETREQELVAENSRLRTALKRGLAERVVDQKITLGLHTPEEREQLLEEHMKRSAGSLADSLRDLASLPQQTAPSSGAPKLEPTGLATGNEGRDEIVDDVEDPTSTEQQIDPEEDLFVEVLMGRRSL